MEKNGKGRTYRLISAIYKLCREGEWRVKFTKLRKDVGVIDPERKIIYIDPWKEETLSTFMHECMHVIFGNRKEREVIRLENMLMENISRTQAQRLMLAMAEMMVKIKTKSS